MMHGTMKIKKLHLQLWLGS